MKGGCCFGCQSHACPIAEPFPMHDPVGFSALQKHGRTKNACFDTCCHSSPCFILNTRWLNVVYLWCQVALSMCWPATACLAAHLLQIVPAIFPSVPPGVLLPLRLAYVSPVCRRSHHATGSVLRPSAGDSGCLHCSPRYSLPFTLLPVFALEHLGATYRSPTRRRDCDGA